MRGGVVAVRVGERRSVMSWSSSRGPQSEGEITTQHLMQGLARVDLEIVTVISLASLPNALEESGDFLLVTLTKIGGARLQNSGGF